MQRVCSQHACGSTPKKCWQEDKYSTRKWRSTWRNEWCPLCSQSKRLSTLLKRVRFQKLRISSLYPTTSHCCLRLKILLKDLLRLKKQTWTTNKFVLCWLHHCIYRSERQVRNEHKFIELHVYKETCGMALTSERSGQDEFSEREQLADIVRGNESIFRDANPANVAKSLLEGNRDHLLTQPRSELMKQEHKVESLNNCIYELQQQAYVQRLDLENAHHGYVESRREQVRLQEELSLNEKVLRETQIRNIHELGEMKRAQEPRVDEFSEQKLRESHETKQRLTSQVQELQERMNHLSDSEESHELVELVGNFHTFPVGQQGFQVCDLCWAATNAGNLKHGIHLDQRKTFLQIHIRRSSYCKYLIKELILSWHQMLQVRLPRLSAGRLVAREEEIIGSTVPMPTFAGRPPTMSSFNCGYSIEFYGWAAKTADIGTNSPLHNHFLLEDKIQKPDGYLFWFSLGGNVADQRGGAGRFSGWINIL